jgi:hypothetical protein
MKENVNKTTGRGNYITDTIENFIKNLEGL